MAGFRSLRWILASTAVIGFLLALQTSPVAQTNQLRGLPQSGSTVMPSARQQLNQNLNRQQNTFSNRQRLNDNNRLNHTNQINRNNTRPGTIACPSANQACNNQGANAQ